MGNNLPIKEQTVLNAGCKVNLYLRILGCREDGYHELESLFLPLSAPKDTLVISPGRANSGIRVQSSLSDLDGESNILVKAYQIFAQTFKYWPDLNVKLEKNIPVGAGLGGGSSDAAALLDYLFNILPHSSRASREIVQKTALQVGSDVPFFLVNRPAWVTGIGETCTPVKLDLSGNILILITPDQSVPTAWAYKKWDEYFKGKDQVNGKQNCLTRRATEIKEFPLTPQGLFFNSFEKVIFEYYPSLRSIKEEVLDLGAKQCVLSGSGASMVALVEYGSSATNQVLSYLQNRQIKYYTHLM
jgi:4-diphosphocytidyl-2-C-methyl-D-erythritol kinase